MIGLTLGPRALGEEAKAPNTVPWSVIAIASMPSSAVRANISPSRAAPSSMEYSVCTCRCTKESFTRDPVDMWGDRPFPDVDTDRAHAGTDLGGPAALLLGEDRQPTSRRPPDVEDVPVCSRVNP